MIRKTSLYSLVGDEKNVSSALDHFCYALKIRYYVKV